MRVMKTFVEGLRYYKDNREFVLKVTADFAQNRDPNVLNPTYDVVTRFQDRVPYVNMKGIEFMLKTLEAARPARQNLRSDNASSIRASFRNWRKPALSMRCGKNKSSPSSSYEQLCRGNPLRLPSGGQARGLPLPKH